MNSSNISLRAKVEAPVRVYSIPVKNSKLPGLPQMDAEAEELFWAQVWRERGLPDPVTVTPAEFRRLVKERNGA